MSPGKPKLTEEQMDASMAEWLGSPNHPLDDAANDSESISPSMPTEISHYFQVEPGVEHPIYHVFFNDDSDLAEYKDDLDNYTTRQRLCGVLADISIPESNTKKRKPLYCGHYRKNPKYPSVEPCPVCQEKRGRQWKDRHTFALKQASDNGLVLRVCRSKSHDLIMQAIKSLGLKRDKLVRTMDTDGTYRLVFEADPSCTSGSPYTDIDINKDDWKTIACQDVSRGDTIYGGLGRRPKPARRIIAKENRIVVAIPMICCPSIDEAIAQKIWLEVCAVVSFTKNPETEEEVNKGIKERWNYYAKRLSEYGGNVYVTYERQAVDITEINWIEDGAHNFRFNTVDSNVVTHSLTNAAKNSTLVPTQAVLADDTKLTIYIHKERDKIPYKGLEMPKVPAPRA